MTDNVSRLKNVAKTQHQANTNIHKTLNWATVPFRIFPETSHIFKPLLNAVLYFQNLKNQRNVYPQSLVFGFQMSRKLGLSRKVFRQRIVSKLLKFENFLWRFYTKFGFSFSLSREIFRLQFSLIILRKNRSEAFCVSSENILHLTFCGLKMWRICNTKPSQI